MLSDLQLISLIRLLDLDLVARRYLLLYAEMCLLQALPGAISKIPPKHLTHVKLLLTNAIFKINEQRFLTSRLVNRPFQYTNLFISTVLLI